MCCVDFFVESSFIFVIYILLLKKSGCVVFLECSAPFCDNDDDDDDDDAGGGGGGGCLPTTFVVVNNHSQSYHYADE